MSTVVRFQNLVAAKGSDVVYHRQDSLVVCPCRTPEGFRDPEWHLANPSEPVCNEQGFLPGGLTQFSIKGFVQPVQSPRGERINPEIVQTLFPAGIEIGDHIGIFPFVWGGNGINFEGWSQSGEDWLSYNGMRFMAVGALQIPDPSDGNPNHHWEVALRLINSEPL